MNQTELDLLAQYLDAKRAVQNVAQREKAAGVNRVTEDRLAVNARFDEIARRVPWHLR